MNPVRWQKIEPGAKIESGHGRRYVVTDVKRDMFRGKPRVVEVIAVQTVRATNPNEWRMVPKTSSPAKVTRGRIS